MKTLDGLLLMGRGLETVVMPATYLTVAAAAFTSLAWLLFPRWARVE